MNKGLYISCLTALILLISVASAEQIDLWAYFNKVKITVDGRVYDISETIPIPSNANVKIYGHMYKQGNPLSNAKIVLDCDNVWNGPILTTVTDEKGYFEFELKAGDWRREGLCGSKFIFASIKIPSEDVSKEIIAIAVCNGNNDVENPSGFLFNNNDCKIKLALAGSFAVLVVILLFLLRR